MVVNWLLQACKVKYKSLAISKMFMINIGYNKQKASDHCGSGVWYLLLALVRKVCDFFLARHLRDHFMVFGFLPNKRKKGNPLEHSGKLCSVICPKCRTAGEPGLKRALPAIKHCLWKPTVWFVPDGCLQGQLWHRLVMQLVRDSKKETIFQKEILWFNNSSLGVCRWCSTSF